MYSDPLAETDTTVYTFCGVMFPRWQRVYHYRTEDETLTVGDKVLVPGRDGPTEAEVVSIEKCLRKTAPYPVDRAKFVVGDARSESQSKSERIYGDGGKMQIIDNVNATLKTDLQENIKKAVKSQLRLPASLSMPIRN